jgi:hypothetical protein
MPTMVMMMRRAEKRLRCCYSPKRLYDAVSVAIDTLLAKHCLRYFISSNDIILLPNLLYHKTIDNSTEKI